MFYTYYYIIIARVHDRKSMRRNAAQHGMYKTWKSEIGAIPVTKSSHIRQEIQHTTERLQNSIYINYSALVIHECVIERYINLSLKYLVNSIIKVIPLLINYFTTNYYDNDNIKTFNSIITDFIAFFFAAEMKYLYWFNMAKIMSIVTFSNIML